LIFIVFFSNDNSGLNNKDTIIREFSTVRENAREEIEAILEGRKCRTQMFTKELFGYEVFLFKAENGLDLTRHCDIKPKGI